MPRKTRVLFIPYFRGIPSHLITLLKLYQRLDAERYEAAFYLPRHAGGNGSAPASDEVTRFFYGGEFYDRIGVPILDVDMKVPVSSDLAAYERFKPDLIIDDCSLSTGLVRRMRKVPRVTLLRTTFSESGSRDARHKHSVDQAIEALREGSPSHFRVPQRLQDYCEAEVEVVPGVRSIEAPEHAADPRGRPFFAGPLLLDEREETIFQSPRLQAFFDRNLGTRRIAYITFGAIAVKKAPIKLVDCFRHLFETGFAVVTNVAPAHEDFDVLTRAHGDRYICSRFLPMHYVCSRADLMIHVSSSGMYHYPLLHRKPAITLGTQCYDREGTARTMESLGLSRHVPAPEEADRFTTLFREAVASFLEARYPFDRSLPQRFEPVGTELDAAARQFEIDRVVQAALAA